MRVILAEKPADAEALASCKVSDGNTVENYLKGQTAVIGEKIAVRRFTAYETEGFLAKYIHLGGKLGVLVDMARARGKPMLEEGEVISADDLRTLAVIYDVPATTLCDEFIAWGVLNADARRAVEHG